MDKLYFLTPGVPYSTKKKRNIENGLKRIKELDLDGMEIEYVRGVHLDYKKAAEYKGIANDLKLILTAHAPYYINLYSKEREKVDASFQYILNTARMLDAAGGYSVVFHAAYYMGNKPTEVFSIVRERLGEINRIAQKEALKVWIRPELMGKKTQFGSLSELLNLTKELGGRIMPCVDFAHLHARYGKHNTYEEFASVFEMIKNELGEEALFDMHIHVSGIKYSEKGEISHLNIRQSDFKIREFLKCLKDYNICGALVCESPNIEGDTLLLKMIYESM
ncbi:MAG: TIM barrel protein [Brevinematia bacterium]